MASLIGDLSLDNRSKKNQLLPIALRLGLNAAGGVAAGRLNAYFTQHFPNYHYAPEVGITIVSFVMKWGLIGESNLQIIGTEMAAGMAGWVGDEVLMMLWDWFTADEFKIGVAYKMGTKVKHNGKIWKAGADLVGTTGSEPGRDPKWTYAQGIDPKQLRELTSQILNDEGFRDMLTKAQGAVLGPELDRIAGQSGGLIELNDATRGMIADRMRSSLREVAQSFHQMVG